MPNQGDNIQEKTTMTTTIVLTAQEENALQRIAQQTGRSEDELIREAVAQYIQHYQASHRGQLLQQARGMWRDRTDLPSLETLRQEFDDHGQNV
jgi:predicted transcriptional regulator